VAEQLIEGSVARLLKARLQPVEVARYLARAMEDGQVVGARGQVVVPNHYWVRMHPDDFAAMQSYRDTLQDELARYVASLARAAGATMPGRPRVRVLAHNSVPLRRVRVVARVVSARPRSLDLTHTQEWSPQAVASAQSSSLAAAATTFVLAVGGRRMPVSEAVVTIGRSLDNDIVIDEGTVSRQHAQLRRRYGQYVIYDLGSQSGTLVNGHPVREAPLEDGDVVSLGGVEIHFERLTGSPLRTQETTGPVRGG
jgi:hypothetical protein